MLVDSPVATAMGLRAGMPVEVLTHFTGSWARGFEVVGLEPNSCRVRRVSDGAVLPTDFDLDDVRALSADRFPADRGDRR
jgi:hypothetical protein